MSSFRHWDGGENCAASNESPETKPYTFALLYQQEVVQRFFHNATPEFFWYLSDFSWCNENSENYFAVNEHIHQILWISSDTNDIVGKVHFAVPTFLPFDFFSFFNFFIWYVFLTKKLFTFYFLLLFDYSLLCFLLISVFRTCCNFVFSFLFIFFNNIFF